MPVLKEIVEEEVLDAREEPAPFHEREYLVTMARDESLVRRLVLVRAPVFHAVLFLKALNLPVPEHREPRHRDHHRADAEVFVSAPELRDGRFLVGVVHEVDVPLEDLGVKLEGVLDSRSVLRVILALEHVHERGVVHAVHAERADEVAFHHPEGFCEEERVGDLARAAVNHLAPELFRYAPLELVARERVLRAARDVSALSRLGIPESLNVFFREHHRGVEPDDREIRGDVEDFLDDLLARLGIEKVDLGRVVPRHAGSVVPVVDVARVACRVVDALEYDRAVGLCVVMVLEVNADPAVMREVFA